MTYTRTSEINYNNQSVIDRAREFKHMAINDPVVIAKARKERGLDQTSKYLPSTDFLKQAALTLLLGIPTAYNAGPIAKSLSNVRDNIGARASIVVAKKDETRLKDWCVNGNHPGYVTSKEACELYSNVQKEVAELEAILNK